MNRVIWTNGHPAPSAAAEATGVCPGHDVTNGTKAGQHDKTPAANAWPCKAGNAPND